MFLSPRGEKGVRNLVLVISLDGAAVVTDTAATLPTVTTDRFGHDYNNDNHWNATLARFTEWASGRPNTKLVELAT